MADLVKRRDEPDYEPECKRVFIPFPGFQGLQLSSTFSSLSRLFFHPSSLVPWSLNTWQHTESACPVRPHTLSTLLIDRIPRRQLRQVVPRRVRHLGRIVRSRHEVEEGRPECKSGCCDGHQGFRLPRSCGLALAARRFGSLACEAARGRWDRSPKGGRGGALSCELGHWA